MKISNDKIPTNTPVDTGRKLNARKTFRRRSGRLLNVLCTFNLRPVSVGTSSVFHAETTWKRPLPQRLNVEYMWCVCRDIHI